MKKTRSRARSKRNRFWRARYRRRRLLGGFVLACLFFTIGTQAAAFFKGEEAGSVGAKETAGSPGFVPVTFEGLLAQEDSGTIPTDEAKKNLASSRSRELATETRDQSARKEALEARKQARLEARKEAARLEASKEAAKEAREEAARRAAAKEAEQASGEPLDVLVLGVDRRPSSAEGESTRSDTMMLVRVIPATGEVKLLSVPRDLYVEVQSGEKDRINTAYAYGGVEKARAVMEDLSGVHIDNYVVVDFKGFEKVIDAMGKVRVDVGKGVFPEPWNMGEGFERLNGHKALKYARYRGTPGADLDRIDHQQKLLAALRRQALRWDTVTRLPAIVRITNENVNTDLGIMQVIPLARALVLNGEDNKMTRAELEGNPKFLSDGEQVLVPDVEANEAILQDFRQ